MMTIREFEKRFPDETACLDYLVGMRWPDGVTCPRCANSRVYKLSRPYRWQCKRCQKNGYRFSPIAGTIFENTNIRLRTWFRVVFYMCQAKKGMSALQIHRMIGTGSYKTAWYMCHRIRAAMQGDVFSLTGEVEVDETYVGGKDENRHQHRKSSTKRKQAGPQLPGEKIGYDKIGVIGAIERKGNVLCRVIDDTDARTIASFVDKAVAENVSLVATDSAHTYKYVRRGLPHQAVNHTKREYVRGNVHTCNIDGFWSLLKRGIMGSFHQVSKTYLPLYLNEFSFRHNNRKNPNMFDAVIAGC